MELETRAVNRTSCAINPKLSGITGYSRGCRCRPCREAKRAEYERHKPEWILRTAANKKTPSGKVADKAWRIKARYGLTHDEYAAMVLRQHGKCLICGILPSPRELHLDHNHKTGQVRGLLCGPCNRGLGSFRDSPEVLRKAADYLEKE